VVDTEGVWTNLGEGDIADVRQEGPILRQE
jgi:hypothetical protein